MTDQNTYPLPETKVPLGVEAQDTISGYTGITTSILYKLSGSVMIGLQPEGDGKTIPDAMMLDEQSIIAVPGGRTIPATACGAPLVKLGQEVQDRITDLKGTVTALILHVNGCITAIVTSKKVDKEGRLREEHLDHKRLVIKGKGVSVDAPPKKAAQPVRSGGANMRAYASR